MTTRRSVADQLLTAGFLTMVFVLAFNKVQDTDAWMHLAVGREIVKLHGFPATEPWVFTAAGQPFVFTSWLFAVVFYLAYRFLGFAGVIVLKALILAMGFSYLLKDSLRPRGFVALSVPVLTGAVLVTYPRFVERPDIVSLGFLAFVILAIRQYLDGGGRHYLFTVPLVVMLWANIHTSVNLILVPFVAFLAGGLIHFWLGRRGIRLEPAPPLPRLQTVSLVFLASLLASLLNPNGWKQWYFGGGVLSSSWFKQEIVELQTPVWSQDPRPFVVAAIVVLSFALNWRRLSLVDCALVLPFVILGLIARRFLFFQAIVAAPIVARNLSIVLAGTLKCSRALRRAVAGAACASLVLCPTLVWGRMWGFGELVQVPGVGANHDMTPEGALRFMDSRGIQGRIFNEYELGGYIIWRDFPHRAPFVDGRGAIPAPLLETLDTAPQNPAVFDSLDKLHAFDVVLLAYRANPPVELSFDTTFSNPRWALVYWDDRVCLYLKRDGHYASVVARDEYRVVIPANEIPGIQALPPDLERRLKATDELKRNVVETGSSRGWAMLGTLYNQLGRFRQAIEAFSHVRPSPGLSFLQVRYYGTGVALMGLHRPDEAIASFKSAQAIMDHALVLDALGQAYMATGDRFGARDCFEKAIATGKASASVYSELVQVYRELGKENKAQEIQRMLGQAVNAQTGALHFEAGVRAYTEKRFSAAIDEFTKSIEFNPRNGSTYGNLGFVYFDLGQIDLSVEMHQKAIEIDPKQANSHYGLAMIYTHRGDHAEARRHWQEYLRLEPSGYFSRKAKEELDRLGRSAPPK